MPENYLYLGLLAALFPAPPSSTAAATSGTWPSRAGWPTSDAVHWANDPGHIAAIFRAYLRLMDHWRAALPATIHEVDYEETVADLEGVARRLLSALRPRLGPGLPGVPPHQPAGPHREP